MEVATGEGVVHHKILILVLLIFCIYWQEAFPKPSQATTFTFVSSSTVVYLNALFTVVIILVLTEAGKDLELDHVPFLGHTLAHTAGPGAAADQDPSPAHPLPDHIAKPCINTSYAVWIQT